MASAVAMAAPVPRAIPISVRKPGEAAGGNRISSRRISGPLAEQDPRARIEEVRALIQAARGEPAGDIVGLFSPTLARLPGPLLAPLVGQMTKDNDLQASNLPGLQEDAYLAGGKVERTYGFGPLRGHGDLRQPR